MFFRDPKDVDNDSENSCMHIKDLTKYARLENRNNDQTCSCPRDWHHGGANKGHPEALKHHSTMVSMSLGGLLLDPPLC